MHEFDSLTLCSGRQKLEMTRYQLCTCPERKDRSNTVDIHLEHGSKSQGGSSAEGSSSDHRLGGASSNTGSLGGLWRVELGKPSGNRERVVADGTSGNRLGDGSGSVMAIEVDLFGFGTHGRFTHMGEGALPF